MKRVSGDFSYHILVVLQLLISTRAPAQSTFGGLRITVQDSAGAAIPGAHVTAHSISEGTDRETTSGATGEASFENLKPGNYRIVVHENGFGDAVVSEATVAARQELRLPLTLNVAATMTSIEVTSSTSTMNTENGTIADEKSNTEITQLPINNRATTTSPIGSLQISPNVQQDSAGNIAIGGATSSMINFSVDGISTANVRENGALQDAYPSQEGIASVKVTAFNNSAEFSQAADVTFLTRGGTNALHGSLFEYLQNDALDATPYGFSAKAPKRFNTYGVSVGGPVILSHIYDGRNRTFFFVTYEANRRTTAVAQQFLVPSISDRAGDLRDLGYSQNGGVVDPASISATAKTLLAFYPLPNVLGATVTSKYNYEHFQIVPARTDGADIRVDQTIDRRQSFYARFSRKNISSAIANALLPNDVDSVHNRGLLVSHTSTITPHLLNEFRFGFTNVLTSVSFPIGGADAVAELDIKGVDTSQHPYSHAFPSFNFSNGTGFQTIGRDKTGVTESRTLQLTDNITFSAGPHTFKSGLDIRRVRYFDLESFAPVYNSDDFGTFAFQPNFYLGNSFADFLAGTPQTLLFAVSSPDVGGTSWQYSLFVQDELQLTQRLTLNYGLRWEFLPGFDEDGGNLANFDQRTNSIVVPDELSAYLSKRNLTSSNLAFQNSFNACNLGHTSLPCTKYLSASQARLPQSLRNAYKGNLQPRVAFAYRPFADTKTVVRAGFGIFTMTNLGPLSFNNSGNPTSNLHTYTNTLANGTPAIRFPNTSPAGGGPSQVGGGSLDQGVDPNFRDPQSNQWNVTVERQLSAADTLRISYVGMHTYRLSVTEDLNQIAASTLGYVPSPYVDPRAPYQNWAQLYTTLNAGKANYRAIEFDLQHAPSSGLYFAANYTLAENKADNQGDVPSGFAGEVNYGTPIADRFHVDSDYGNVEGTRRHRVLLSGAWQLPVGRGRRYFASGWLGEIVAGWELNAISLLQTGPWLTPTISASADASNTNVANRGASLRPDIVSHDFYRGQNRTAFFNLAAFAPTPANAGRFGNAGVGILQGPGTIAVSAGAAKVMPLGERAHLRFETSFTNLVNRTNFAPPSTQVDNPQQFGVLSAGQTAENAGKRTGQAALRIDF